MSDPERDFAAVDLQAQSPDPQEQACRTLAVAVLEQARSDVRAAAQDRIRAGNKYSVAEPNAVDFEQAQQFLTGATPAGWRVLPRGARSSGFASRPCGPMRTRDARPRSTEVCGAGRGGGRGRRARRNSPGGTQMKRQHIANNQRQDHVQERLAILWVLLNLSTEIIDAGGSEALDAILKLHETLESICPDALRVQHRSFALITDITSRYAGPATACGLLIFEHRPERDVGPVEVVEPRMEK